MNSKLVVKTLVVGQLATNCYIIYDLDSLEGVVVDPGDDADYIIQILSDWQVKPTRIIATHGHFDHILGAFELQTAFSIPFLIHTEDVFLVNRMQDTAKHFLKYNVEELSPRIDDYLEDGLEIRFGSRKLQVICTPGHTPGSVCLYIEDENVLFAGDTIFAEGEVGRTDFQYSSNEELRNSLKKILILPRSTVVFPGHGESTTIKVEAETHLY